MTGKTQSPLERLLRVARRLSGSSELDEVLSVIIDAMRDLLDAERATVFEYDAAANELFSTVAHGVEGGELRIPLEAGIAGECARKRAIINVPDASADARFDGSVDQRTGFVTRSILAIPLLTEADELVGVAQVLNSRGGRFDAGDEAIATALAAQAGVAIRRTHLLADQLARHRLEHDLSVARLIQDASLPAVLPTPSGFELDAWIAPADLTGGDVYDVIPLPPLVGGGPPRLLLLLADATGHGIGPALSVTQMRAMVRMGVRMNGQLEEVARHVNDQLREDLPGGRFITAWFGVLDPATSTLDSFSAGQGPIFHYACGEDKPQELSVDVAPLGILPLLQYAPAATRTLAPGDLLIAASDGVFETRHWRDGELFGTKRVHEIVRQHRNDSPTTIIAALRAALEAFRGTNPPLDDRTILVVKRTGA